MISKQFIYYDKRLLQLVEVVAEGGVGGELVEAREQVEAVVGPDVVQPVRDHFQRGVEQLPRLRLRQLRYHFACSRKKCCVKTHQVHFAFNGLSDF